MAERRVYIPCDPCNFEGTISEGIGFCTKCQEYLCTDCLRAHKKYSALRRHKILKGNDLPKFRTPSSNADDTVLCEVHQQTITQFCVAHTVPLCDLCFSVDHRNCKGVSDIYNVIKKEGVSDKMKTFLAHIKSLTDRFQDLENQQRTEKENIEQLKEKCYDEIKIFRQEINSLLDDLEKKMCLEVDLAIDEEIKLASHRMSVIQNGLKVLRIASHSAEKAKTLGDIRVYLDLNKLRPSVENTEDLLKDTVKDMYNINITFEADSVLRGLLTECKQFGKVTVQRPAAKPRLPSAPSTIECFITGIHVFDTGDTLKCNTNNNKVELMDSSGQITSTLCMKSGPWDVTGIGKGEAAVALPTQKKIDIVRVEGKLVKLQKGRSMKTYMICCGLAYHRDNLYVSCHDSRGNTEVIILGKQGQLIRTIPGPEHLLYPNCIAVDREGKMYLSDWCTNTLTCMTPSGKTVYTSPKADTGLISPTGLLVDKDQNVYYVGHRTHNLQIISGADGRLYRILCNKREGMDKTPSVGMYKDYIKLYKFT